jgi:hypothetical protein
MLGGCGERGGEVGAGGSLWGVAAALGPDWGFWWFLAKCRLKAQSFPTVVAGLNNQRGGGKVTVPKFKGHFLGIFRS